MKYKRKNKITTMWLKLMKILFEMDFNLINNCTCKRVATNCCKYVYEEKRIFKRKSVIINTKKLIEGNV